MSNWKRFEVEVTRKAIEEPKKMRVESPNKAADMFAEDAQRRATESLWVMTVDGRNGLMGIEQVYSGTATGTSVRVAELFRYAIAVGGVGIVLVHNHPSGDHEPSEEDIKLTQEVLRAAKVMDIEVLDHLVIGTDGFSSIRAQNQSIWMGDEPTPLDIFNQMANQ